MSLIRDLESLRKYSFSKFCFCYTFLVLEMDQMEMGRLKRNARTEGKKSKRRLF